MAAPSVKVTHKPDMKRLHLILRQEMALGLVETGKECVLDNVRRIDQRIAYDDGAQKPNSLGYAEWKKKEKGHDIPLRCDDVLRNPTGYTINGMGAMGTIYPPTEELEVRVRITTDGIPPRDQVVGWLRERGYRYWGLSQFMRTFFMARMAHAVQRAKEGYRLRYVVK